MSHSEIIYRMLSFVLVMLWATDAFSDMSRTCERDLSKACLLTFDPRSRDLEEVVSGMEEKSDTDAISSGIDGVGVFLRPANSSASNENKKLLAALSKYEKDNIVFGIMLYDVGFPQEMFENYINRASIVFYRGNDHSTITKILLLPKLRMLKLQLPDVKQEVLDEIALPLYLESVEISGPTSQSARLNVSFLSKAVHLSSLYLSIKADEENVIETIDKLAKLEAVSLPQGRYSYGNLVQLCQTSSLRYLNLTGCMIGPEELDGLAGCSHLNILILDQNYIDENCESVLSSMKLSLLSVRNTRLSRSDIARLRSLLPNCTVLPADDDTEGFDLLPLKQ